MQKRIAALILTAILLLTFTVPVSAAASVVTQDSFSDGIRHWESDDCDPGSFSIIQGALCISVADGVDYKAEPGFYETQGKKLPVEKTSTGNWTATVKVKVDLDWSSSYPYSRRAEMRVDLVDKDGNPVADAPSIAIVKGGNAQPSMRFYDPKTNSGYRTVTQYTRRDNTYTLDYTPDWYTLYIVCEDGELSYYYDDGLIGTVQLDDPDVYPEAIFLGVGNYGKPDLVFFDSVTLRDGASHPYQRTDEQISERDSRRADAYEKRRQRWEERYTVNGVLTKQIPDSYWKY